ncbi:MAG: (Fe-S)-binding protein [Herpetosiphon sp.]|nr:(Fe-S)-binding protein [Herpetosiphon sp.]
MRGVLFNQVIAYREIYWNLPHGVEILVYIAAIASIGLMFYKVYQDVRLWRKGYAVSRSANFASRLWDTTSQVLGQKRVLKDRIPGVMHTFIFYGFLALFIGTDVIAAEADFTIPIAGEEAGKILTGGFYQYYELILDVMGAVFVIGLLWAAWRRYKTKPTRLDNRSTDAWVLGSMLFIGLGGYLIEILRLANQTMPYVDANGVTQQAIVYEQSWAKWAVLGYPMASVLRAIGLGVTRAADGTIVPSEIALNIHRILWFSHMFVVFAFVGSIPFSKFRHIFYTPLNNLFRDREPKGALDRIPNMEAELEKDEPRLGVTSISDFSWKRRMDFDACMRCGRCQANCPAFASGSDLSPKWLITKMSDLMHGGPVLKRDGTVIMLDPVKNGNGEHSGGETADVDAAGGKIQRISHDIETLPLYEHGIVTENELWSCTTCRACMTECPATIEHVDDIIDFRRNLTMVMGEIPSGVKNVLQGIERSGNPWKLPQRDRTAWANGLDVPTMAEKEDAEVLYWVGCAPSYDDRSKKTARAMVQLMQKAGVDFAILGDEETCTGDPARRMGEELLYEQQATTNIETMGQYKFKKIVTTCAHCYNTVKNEYPQFGGKAGVDYEVVHHTDFLNDLVEQGKLKPTKPLNQKVVYHDPCYIGRYNDIYEEPRNVLSHIPGVELVEAGERNREKAMCCGGGGGNVWLEGWGDKGVNVIRLEQLQTNKPDTVAMGCPFCMVMFEDAAKNTGQSDTLGRKDVAEMLLESLE